MNLRGAGSEFVTMMKKEYPDSLKILQDKKLMAKYIQECQEIIKKSGIKYEDLVIHNRT